MSKRFNLCVLGFAVIAPCFTAVVYADDAKSQREHELLRRAQQEIQKYQAENSQLQRDKSESETKLKDALARIETLEKSAKDAETHSAALAGELRQKQASDEALASKLGDINQQFSALKQKQEETAAKLAQRESELARAGSDLDLSKKTIGACEDKNAKLYQYGQTLLQRYEKKGVWDSLTQKEPVLGLKQVEIEGVVQEYHDKLAAELIPPPKQ